MKYIAAIGVELEGGWEEEAPPGLYGDGSVDVDAEYQGEIHCQPLNSLDKVASWMSRRYPDEVNGSCGFHIHLSFKSIGSYMGLMEQEFYDYFLERMECWGDRNIPNRPPDCAGCDNYDSETPCGKCRYDSNPDSSFWRRLEGRNTYCQRVFQPDDQVNSTYRNGSRYAHLNFCYSLHGTMEIRLMPMFNSVSTAISALTEIVECVESYLDQQSFSPIILEVTEPMYRVGIEPIQREEFVCV